MAVERAGRFIEQQNGRVAQNRASNGDSPALAVFVDRTAHGKHCVSESLGGIGDQPQKNCWKKCQQKGSRRFGSAGRLFQTAKPAAMSPRQKPIDSLTSSIVPAGCDRPYSDELARDRMFSLPRT